MEIIDLLKQIRFALSAINGSIWQYDGDSDELSEYAQVLNNISSSVTILYSYVDKIITDEEEISNE